ncbi:MAG TPA: hypothetical protein VFA43_05470 [Gemmatimonadaceae bacterium]|nr:hypothetical protein [Gemmatimonadaceae bacterium]
MSSAIEAFEREFAPWALKLPAADVAARRNGQLRANGWSVLYEFGSDAYGDYLDYYAALREGTDARVTDDWHARIYETGQVVAFPAVMDAYLYGRDPSPEELTDARAPVLASLAPPAGDSDIGSADTALWADLRDVVEAHAPPEKPTAPRRPSAETPAEIDNLLDATFGGIPVEEKEPEEVAAAEQTASDEPEMLEAPAPRRSVPRYDPFVELRTLEPKSARRAAPTGDDFRPYWQKYPARAAGVAAGLAAVLLIAFMVIGHKSSKPGKRIATADTTFSGPATSTTPAADSTPTAMPAPDTQGVANPSVTPDTGPVSAPTPTPSATPASASPNESSVAKPVGPGSIAPIVRAHPSGS